MDLAISEDNTSAGEFARAILEAFPKFQSFNIKLFNEKPGFVHIDTLFRCVAPCTFLHDMCACVCSSPWCDQLSTVLLKTRFSESILRIINCLKLQRPMFVAYQIHFIHKTHEASRMANLQWFLPTL